jgi:hypothetical protein
MRLCSTVYVADCHLYMPSSRGCVSIFAGHCRSLYPEIYSQKQWDTLLRLVLK